VGPVAGQVIQIRDNDGDRFLYLVPIDPPPVHLYDREEIDLPLDSPALSGFSVKGRVVDMPTPCHDDRFDTAWLRCVEC
jgi:hypothetical protein